MVKMWWSPAINTKIDRTSELRFFLASVLMLLMYGSFVFYSSEFYIYFIYLNVILEFLIYALHRMAFLSNGKIDFFLVAFEKPFPRRGKP